jgi:hypothetical protein
LTARRLRLELEPSALLAAVILAAHGAAAACVLLVMPGMAGTLIAAALVGLGAMAAATRALLSTRGSVCALELEGSGLTVCLADGKRFAAEVAPRRYVGRHLVILPLRGNTPRGMRRTILVTRDMLGSDAFRRLRVWALWGKLPAVAAKQLAA